MTHIKNQKFKRCIAILYWIALISLILYLPFRWSNLLENAGYEHSSEGFDLERDFYQNFDTFQEAADMLLENQSVFVWEDGRKHPLVFFSDDTPLTVFSHYNLDKVISKEDWSTIERLNDVKNISYIGIVDSYDIKQDISRGILFIFTIKNNKQKGSIRLYYFPIISSMNIHDNTTGEIRFTKTDKQGWYYEYDLSQV